MESLGEGIVAVLFASDLDVAIARQFRRHGEDGLAGAIKDLVEARGEEPRFQTSGAEHGLLGQSDALDGEEFLSIDWLIDGNEVGLQVIDFIQVFETDNGEYGASEIVFAAPWRTESRLFRSGLAGNSGRRGRGGPGSFFGNGFGRQGLASHVVRFRRQV